MNREDILAVIDRVPELTYFGVGLYEGPCPKTTRKNCDKNKSSFLILSAICTKVCEWLATVKPSRQSIAYPTSYGLKHTAEWHIGEYVSNGVFIAAAIHCGFRYRRDGDSANMLFAMSERSLNRPTRITVTTGPRTCR